APEPGGRRTCGERAEEEKLSTRGRQKGSSDGRGSKMGRRARPADLSQERSGLMAGCIRGEKDRRASGARLIDSRRMEEDDARSPARLSCVGSRKGDRGEDHARRANRGGGTRGPVANHARPTDAATEKEGWTRRDTHRPTISSREEAGKGGHHRRQGADYTRDGEKNGRGGTTHRRGGGSGRGRKVVSGNSKVRRVGTIERAGPRVEA
ncbi:unnamed protein product, partial [Closterium sp. Naga37s-1]